MSKNEEVILAARTRSIFSGNRFKFQGVQTDKQLVKEILDRIASSIVSGRRGDFEEDPLFKQPIPYTILKRGDEIFLYRRLEQSGEKRLKGKGSIGIGGHMNPLPGATFNEVVLDNLKRELEEEVSLSGKIQNLEVIGLINDDTNDVGKVHICLLAVAELSEDSTIEVKEVDVLEGSFVKISKAKKMKNLENWSKIALEIL